MVESKVLIKHIHLHGEYKFFLIVFKYIIYILKISVRTLVRLKKKVTKEEQRRIRMKG